MNEYALKLFSTNLEVKSHFQILCEIYQTLMRQF